MPLLQIGCSAATLDAAQCELLQGFMRRLEEQAIAAAEGERLRQLVTALPDCATPAAWLDAFRIRLAADLEALLREQAAIATQLSSVTARCAWYEERCAYCAERQRAAEGDQWQGAYAALAQDLEQTQATLEQVRAALAYEREAHAATRVRLEAETAAQNALIVKLREELKARA